MGPTIVKNEETFMLNNTVAAAITTMRPTLLEFAIHRAREVPLTQEEQIETLRAMQDLIDEVYQTRQQLAIVQREFKQTVGSVQGALRRLGNLIGGEAADVMADDE